eukprot:TRINITY_DN109755_c0_g1_i1.p1 TRINITY_DN109755_c0_g1~~TRINITY_DN109755_c0_g1_i1.p1  ORF type:complete len:239 (+),score=26.42 TRINITY_DN109755_c0_g1_i1:46-717(+)
MAAQGVAAWFSGVTWLRGGFCDRSLTACLALGGLPGVIVGSYVARGVSGPVLKLIFACVLCLVMLPITLYREFMSSKQGANRSCREDVDVTVRLLRRPSMLLRHGIVGAIAGFLTGVIGVGDVPIMISYLTSSGISQKVAIGTVTMASALTLSLSAALQLSAGHAVVSLVPVVVAGMSIGSVLGAKMSMAKISDRQLQVAFAAFVLFLGASTGRGAIMALLRG